MDFVLDKLLQSLLELVPGECARVLLLEGETQLLVAREKLRHEVSNKAPEYPLTVDAADSQFLLRILTTQNSVLLADTKNEKEWRSFKGHTGIQSWLCVPLVASQQTLRASFGGRHPGKHLHSRPPSADAVIGDTRR